YNLAFQGANATDGHAYTSPVGAYKNASWCGVYDLVGNVWQWCEDRLGDRYYAESPAVDPKGSDTGSLVVRRGGSWHNDPGNCRSAQRYGGNPNERDTSSGFRVVVECAGLAVPAAPPVRAPEASKKDAAKAETPTTALPPGVTAEEIQNVTQALGSVKALAKPSQARKVLVLSRTKGFRHGHIPLSAQAFEMLGRKTGAFEAVLTDDVSYFAPDKLKGFDAVIFNSNTGEIFEGRGDLMAALLDFVKGGKGMVGVHAVADCCTKWKDFGDMLGGYFNSHPKQDGKILVKMAVKLDEPKHPLLEAFKGQDFEITDEIFQFREPYARAKLRVLLSVDGAKMTLDPSNVKQKDGDYPVSWIRACEKGRVFYCALAHQRSTFWNPTVLQFYLDGIQFAIGDLKLDAADMAPGAK
ncbi:MAG TPA: ThuA domain-containing protein, partial [Phycisphaerae bacterium]|nr:ThuA domain-containing protein [Phycisphaerae bacterium]